MFVRFRIYARIVFGCLLLIANGFAGESAHDPVTFGTHQRDLTTLIEKSIEEIYLNLESFVCNEEIRRFRGSIAGAKLRQIDRLTARVSFENGIERYTDVRQNDRERPAFSRLIGAWSTGEYGTLLRQTDQLLRTPRVPFCSDTEIDGTPATLCSIWVLRQETPWDLKVRAHHYRIPFHTDVWVAKASGQILKLERVSTEVPRQMGISEIRWDVSLQTLELNGRTWLLPKTGRYAVLYGASGRSEWNEMTFSNYHRYGSEVSLRFQ